jgi:hypothetical protein
VIASTRQFRPALSTKPSPLLARSTVNSCVPAIATRMPSAPLITDSTTLSVSSCRIKRKRPAPMLSLTAISR